VLRRRGIFTAIWAAAAALVLKKTEQPVQADGTQGTPLTIGVQNTETAGTHLKWAGTPASTVLLLGNDSGFVPTDAAFPAAAGGWASGTEGTFAGVPNGVSGYTARTGGSGVIGANDSSGPGVRGLTASSGPGVLGEAWGTGNAVRGEIPAFNGSNTIAVYGLNNSSYAGPGPGAGGFGVYGLSAKGHGLVGATSAAGGAAVPRLPDAIRRSSRPFGHGSDPGRIRVEAKDATAAGPFHGESSAKGRTSARDGVSAACSSPPPDR